MAYFNYLNKKIFYDISGEGEPLIILNGIMMSTKSWEIFNEDFSKDFKFIRVDFLDQGQSDSFLEPYTQDIQIELLKGLIDHLGLSKVNIVGISYGGEVSLGFAIKYQYLINKLIVFNTVAYTSAILAKTGHLWNEQASKRNSVEYYKLSIPVIYSDKFISDNQEWMDKREVYLLNGPFSNSDFLDRMIRLTNSAQFYDVREELKDINIPVLIVAGSSDKLTPVGEQEYLNSLIPNSRLLVIQNVGHASMYEVPEIFSMIILGYLKLNKTKYLI